MNAQGSEPEEELSGTFRMFARIEGAEQTSNLFSENITLTPVRIPFDSAANFC